MKTLAALAIALAAVQSATPAPPGCRAFSASEARTMSSTSGVNATITQKCEFNKTTLEFSCRTDYKGSGTSYSVQTTSAFDKVEDFIGDPTRVSLFGRPRGTTMQHTGPGMNLQSKITYEYDATRRPLRMIGQTASGTTRHTFTAWDQFGRPTLGTLDKYQMAYTYDDTKRTGIIANKTDGSTITQTFDANMLQIGQVDVNASGKNTHQWTIHSTSTVCK